MNLVFHQWIQLGFEVFINTVFTDSVTNCTRSLEEYSYKEESLYQQTKQFDLHIVREYLTKEFFSTNILLKNLSSNINWTDYKCMSYATLMCHSQISSYTHVGVSVGTSERKHRVKDLRLYPESDTTVRLKPSALFRKLILQWKVIQGGQQWSRNMIWRKRDNILKYLSLYAFS